MKRLYDPVTVNSPNPIARYAHRRRYHYSVSLTSRLLDQNQSCLDFGYGNGRFLAELAKQRSDLTLVGYDKFSDHQGPFDTIRDVTEAHDGSFNCVCAFEVLEHLFDSDIDDFVALVGRVLKKGGRLIVSVPILQGPVLIPKYINARLVNRVPWRYSLQELVQSTIFHRPVERHSDDGLTYTHKGFHFRMLRERLSTDFVLVDELYQPFPRLWWGFNSQCFSVWQLPRT